MVSDRKLISGISKKIVSGCLARQGRKRGIKIYSVRQGSTDWKIVDHVTWSMLFEFAGSVTNSDRTA